MPAASPWTTRVWQEFHAGNLTRAERDCLLTLRTFRGHGGACFPSHETLAARAKCSVRTVQRALAQGRHLGLVDWHERRVRQGWRWLRTSNEYRFNVPADAVQPGSRAAFRRRATTGHIARGGENRENQSRKEALADMMREAAAMPDLLAARRAVVEARLAHKGAAAMA